MTSHTITNVFQIHLKGYSHALQSQRTGFRVQCQKMGAYVLRGLTRTELGLTCVKKRHQAWTSMPPAASSSELTGGVPLLAFGGRGPYEQKKLLYRILVLISSFKGEMETHAVQLEKHQKKCCIQIKPIPNKGRGLTMSLL